jgi:glutamate/tyrosine decarboxylase-like PLP-dependent enzyme
MNYFLEADTQNIQHLLNTIADEAVNFLQGVSDRPVAVLPNKQDMFTLPEDGIGAVKTLERFKTKYVRGFSGSSGPRYLGFVTGGSTPAAIVGDWLVSVFDQNVASSGDSCAPDIELETINLLRQLFRLSDAHSGSFVTGATMSNFVGLALARQWIAQQHGVDVADSGLYGLPPIKILSATPHSSIFKALSMLGMGRSNVQIVPSLHDREAVDIEQLKQRLHDLKGQPCIVVANAGTVNTVDFDDLKAIAALKQEFSFWMHTDAAFGGFAACSPNYSHLVEGMDASDSITIDAHKWLNVPYDSAMQFTRHTALQVKVFQNSAAYIGLPTDQPDFVHLTPENSRRLRALPAWFTLMAYGANGYQEIIERNCELAQALGRKIENSTGFKLLSPVRLNVVCFTLAEPSEVTQSRVGKFLAFVRDAGKVFLTPTVYQGTPGIRAAFCNWRTEYHDLEIAWCSMTETLARLS